MVRLRDGLLETSDTGGVAVKASDTIRPLGPLEHMFWLLDQNRSVHFAVTAQIAGKASLDDWQDALNRVQERHPILSVCIEGTLGSVPQFRREDAAPIPLRIVEGDPKIRWEDEVGEEFLKGNSDRSARMGLSAGPTRKADRMNREQACRLV